MRVLGAEVHDAETVTVHGAGLRGLRSADLDCGNAGTLARLVTGLLAFQDGEFTLTGDGSLSMRPMERIAIPLRSMGAHIETDDGHLPLTVTGRDLTAIDYELPVASAQVKSAVLFAALGAQGRTTVLEPAPTRDHTELMLREAGVRITTRAGSVSVDPPQSLRLDAVDVPGDFSSAAPFIVAATIVPESRITIHDVGLNPRRTGLLAVLDRMGGRVGILIRRRFGQEPGGDLEIRAAQLTATEIDARGGAAPDRRAAAVRAPRRARPRDEPRARCRRAAAQGVRPDRGARRRAARARAPGEIATRTASK